MIESFLQYVIFPSIGNGAFIYIELDRILAMHIRQSVGVCDWTRI